MLLYALEYIALSYIAMAIIVRSLASVRLPDADQNREANKTLWFLFTISPIGIWILFLIWAIALASYLLQPFEEWLLHESEHDK